MWDTIASIAKAVSAYFGFATKRQDLKNTAAVQKAVAAQQQQNDVDRINKEIAKGDIDELRKEISE